MKKWQWTVITGIVFAVIVAVFSVVNVEKVSVNYVFGTAEWPLVLVILGSVCMGGIIVGSIMGLRIFQLQKDLRSKEKSADYKKVEKDQSEI